MKTTIAWRDVPVDPSLLRNASVTIYRTNTYEPHEEDESMNLDLWKDRFYFTCLGIGIGAGIMLVYILVFMK